MESIIGKTFNHLTVLQEFEWHGSDTKYLCKCSCGKTCIVSRYNIIGGKTKSCGHLKQERSGWKWKNNYGLSKTHIYRVWKNMMSRCYKPNNIAYKDYGGRGIEVCNDWHNLLKFLEWALENGYQKGLSIDRIDVNKGYCPENCVWIELKEQGHNKRNNILVEYHGKTQTLSEWSRELKLPYSLLYHRIHEYHWDSVKAFETPSQRCK